MKEPTDLYAAILGALTGFVQAAMFCCVILLILGIVAFFLAGK